MLREAQALVLLKAYHTELALHSTPWNVKPEDLATGRALLRANDQMRIVVIRTALRHPPQPGHCYFASRELLSQLARRSLPYTTDDIQAILQALSQSRYVVHFPPPLLLLPFPPPLP